MINTKADIDVSVDRSQRGERFILPGTGIHATGNVPPDAQIALDEPGAQRYPIAAARSWHTGKFQYVWLFHAAYSGTMTLTAWSGADVPGPAPLLLQGEPSRILDPTGIGTPVVLSVATGTSTVPVIPPRKKKRIRLFALELTTTDAKIGVAGLLPVVFTSTGYTPSIKEYPYVPAAAPATPGVISRSVPLGPLGVLVTGLGQIDGDGSVAGLPGGLDVTLLTALTGGQINVNGVYRYE